MTPLPATLFLLLLLAGLAAAQQEAQPPTSSSPPSSSSSSSFRSPADAVASRPDLSLLVAAVEAAGLTAQFSSPDLPATIFAPTNGAMERAIKSLSGGGGGDGPAAPQLLRQNRAVLFDVLRYHVVPGAPVWTLDRLRAADGHGSPPLRLMTLLPGASALEVGASPSDGSVLVVGASGTVARVVDGDVRAGASVLHVIDEVLIPEGAGGGGSDGLAVASPPSPSPSPSPSPRVPLLGAKMSDGA
jgi:uncharacterized surface protein with fasciclin (FAS1) repeats